MAVCSVFTSGNVTSTRAPSARGSVSYRGLRRRARVDMQVRSTLLLSEPTRETAPGDPEQFVDVEGHDLHAWSVCGSDEEMAIVEKLDVLDRNVAEGHVLERLARAQIPDPHQPGAVGGRDFGPVRADLEILDDAVMPDQAGSRLPGFGIDDYNVIRCVPSYQVPAVGGESDRLQQLERPADEPLPGGCVVDDQLRGGGGDESAPVRAERDVPEFASQLPAVEEQLAGVRVPDAEPTAVL